jgi:hypothetical protein
LTVALIGSIIAQSYIYYRYNYDMSSYSYAIVWILISGTIYTTIMIDFMILKCYQSLDSHITNKLILNLRIAYTILFFVCHGLAILHILSIVVPNGQRLQELIGSVFVFLSIAYDNAQVIYLTHLVNSTKKRTTDKRIVNEALKKTIRLNLLISSID